MGVTAPKVSKGRSESPLVASADAKPSATSKIKQQITQKAGAALPQKKRHLIHGDDPVSTGVVEGGISEPWPLTTIKRGT